MGVRYLQYPVTKILQQHYPPNPHSFQQNKIMASKIKSDKKNKPIFTLNLDRLHQDSSFELYLPEKTHNNQTQLNLQFPLQQQLNTLHSDQSQKDLSVYVKFLQQQVKTVSNNIQYEYHHRRQTILFLSQVTGSLDSSSISRKKIDQEMAKTGIVRLYDPKKKFYHDYDQQEQSEVNDVGDMAICEIKGRIQANWQAELGDELEKEKKKQKQLQRKKAKELEQIEKDFDKIMKKRKALKEQLLIKSQKSLNESTPSKKQQKKQKSVRKNDQRSKKSNGESSVIESASQLNDHNSSEDQISHQVSVHAQQLLPQNSKHPNGLDVNKLLQFESYDQNGWNHDEIQKININLNHEQCEQSKE